MHKLVLHQLRTATRPDGSIDAEALTGLMRRTYEEFDRERRLTDRAAKLMEEELREANAQVKCLAEQRLADTLESMPSPLVILSPSYCIQSVNSAMTALCANVCRPPLIGELFTEFLGNLVPSSDAAECLGEMQAGAPAELSINKRWYLSSLHRFTDGGLAIAFSDVTVLKERETVLAQAKESAESANRLKSQFLGTMSHELRTPLNAIIGFSEVMKDQIFEPLSTRYREYAGNIFDSGSHLLSLINDVLDITKFDAGHLELNEEAVDVAQTIDKCLKFIEPQAAKARVALVVDIAPHLPLLYADMRRLRQILLNLLSNAVKFTPEGGYVCVTAGRRNGGIMLTVTDTGIGIAAQDIPTAFARFGQIDSRLSRKYEGTGLGLPLARHLVELYGGELELTSEVGVGTTVAVCFGAERVVGEQAVRVTS